MEHTPSSVSVARYRSVLLSLALGITLGAWSQTNPAAQQLPYTQDFGAMAHNSTTLPAGWQGWRIGPAASATFRETPPTADMAMNASSTAQSNSGGVHNYDGKPGMLNSGSADAALVLAINTRWRGTVVVEYDMMTIRNPHNGGTNTRISEATLQYRIGTSGDFNTLPDLEYQTNTTTQTGTVTTPQNSQTRTVTLPPECDNQWIVQLRWVSRDVSGLGARPSIAVDNINIDGPCGTASISYAGSPYCQANSAVLPTITGVAGGWFSGTGFSHLPHSFTGSLAILNPAIGTVTYHIGGVNGCPFVDIPTEVVIAEAATADAGGPYTSVDLDPVPLDATANGSGAWSGGLGYFADVSDTNTTYTPHPDELGTTVEVTWTTDAPDEQGPCGPVSATALLHVDLSVYSPMFAGGSGRGDVMDAFITQLLTCEVDAAHWCMGDTTAEVHFSTSLPHGSGNMFTVELSDAMGDFAAPIIIGTLAGTMSGTITVTVPDVPHATGYLVRVTSSYPPHTGVDNAAPITLDTLTTWYADADGDGAGDPAIDNIACAQPAAYVNNANDGCPDDPLKTAPGACGCGASEFDFDSDGTPDCVDGCPMDPLKTAPGICGCGYADTDSDGDGIADCNDSCPALAGQAGTPCDDGNAGTTNDVLIHDCTCQGTFAVPASYPRRPGSGYALDLDGVNDMVVSTNSSSINPGTGSFTVEAWFKSDLTTASTTQYIMIKYGSGTAGGGPGGLELDTWSLFIWNNGRGGFTLRDGAGVQQNCSTVTSVLDQQWHHLAGVRDVENGRFRLYLDGVLESDDPLAVTGSVAPQNELTIGAQYLYNSNSIGAALNGRLDEVRYWKSALSQAHLRDHLCKKDLSAHPRTSDLVLYHRFDEGSGNSIQDLAGPQNTNGTLINATVATAWVLSGAALGDASAHAYSTPFGAVQFNDPTTTVFTVDDFTGSPVGGHIYRVAQAPDNLTLPSGYTAFDTTEYYGTFFVRSTAPTTSPWWYYNANPLLTSPLAESSLRLARRAGNDGGAFTDDAGQVHDPANDRMDGSAYPRGEFILGMACPIVGLPCEDGDACTVNDTYDDLCNCTGTLDPVADDDEDGTPNCDDPCPYAPDVENGIACDDGDPMTINDTITNCYCHGCTPARFGNGQGYLTICNASIDLTYTCSNLAVPGEFTSTWSLNGTDLGQPNTTTITTTNPGPGDHIYLLVAANTCGADTFYLHVSVQDSIYAGPDISHTTCNATGAFAMNSLLAEDADLGGTWYNVDLGFDNGTDPVFVAFETTADTYTYWYLFNAPECTSDTAVVTVIIEDGGIWAYYDEDHDGYGAPGNMAVLCELVPGYSLNSDDCDDTDANLTIPGALCDDGDACTANDMLNALCNCVGEPVAFADSDADGITDCEDPCPYLPNMENGGACDDGDPMTSDDTIVDCECVGTVVACTENVTVELRTDLNSQEASWEILHQNMDLVICSGSGYPEDITTPITDNCCLPIGCYRLRVVDSGGDGFLTGGYQLRESGINGRRIIDNLGNFAAGGVSAIADSYENGAFCLPISSTRPIFSSCDKLDWVANKFIVVAEEAAVSAAYGVHNANSGYEFWFFDPNGGYSFRRFRSHATSDGYGSGALRANHFKINGWVHSGSTPHIPMYTLLNVRVRGRVNGTNLPFGPACLFKIDQMRAACPPARLQDDPSNPTDYSCGVTRTFGGGNTTANRITANPPQPVPTVASSMVRYQFRFRIPGEGICIVRPPQTSARMQMNWPATSGTPLVCSKTYEVDVRVSLDAGATWCSGPGQSTQAAACAHNEAWGRICRITISGCAQPGNGGDQMASGGIGPGEPGVVLHPNPNHGDLLFLSVGAVEAGINTVSVDIFDLVGKKVAARTVAVQPFGLGSEGFVRSAMDLNGELVNGVYLIHITVGGKAYTERLVIQR